MRTDDAEVMRTIRCCVIVTTVNVTALVAAAVGGRRNLTNLGTPAGFYWSLIVVGELNFALDSAQE